MGNIEALDALRLFRKIEGILQGLTNRFRSRLQDAEALFEGMLCVVLNEIEESALGSALRREDFYFVPGALRQRGFDQFAIFEVRGDVNRFRQIFRFQIKLVQKRRNEL